MHPWTKAGPLQPRRNDNRSNTKTGLRCPSRSLVGFKKSYSKYTNNGKKQQNKKQKKDNLVLFLSFSFPFLYPVKKKETRATTERLLIKERAFCVAEEGRYPGSLFFLQQPVVIWFDKRKKKLLLVLLINCNYHIYHQSLSHYIFTTTQHNNKHSLTHYLFTRLDFSPSLSSVQEKKSCYHTHKEDPTKDAGSCGLLSIKRRAPPTLFSGSLLC